ncbi:MAG TPA: XRE family transcriptional regulator [Providencia sp.]|uniref:helix-turn-helix domain-containing protein n=1 Tax=Providencia sp. TaxID=589 RepID=UPI000E821B88|nr:helix-turn-helix transcriptional regulator [Providencia sp.]HBO21686.1 XRE family transcriptional regulator [Providencia sp.]
MSKKSVSWESAREEILSDPDINALYEKQLRSERVREQLVAWRCSAGLSSSQVAARLGISPAAISRTERNAEKATIETLARYAAACGVKNPKIIL